MSCENWREIKIVRTNNQIYAVPANQFSPSPGTTLVSNMLGPREKSPTCRVSQQILKGESTMQDNWSRGDIILVSAKERQPSGDGRGVTVKHCFVGHEKK